MTTLKNNLNQMKRRSFIRTAAAVAGTTAAIPSLAASAPASQYGMKELYELRVYQLTSGGARETLKKYLLGAVAPYLNSYGGKVGIFSEYSLQEPPKLYVLLTFPEPETILQLHSQMEDNPGYLEKAASYLQSAPDRPLFDRYQSSVLEAFDAIPRHKTPAPERGLMELRIYESYNEDAGRRKIAMFNKEELPLFEKIGLNPLFFGRMLAGTHMPALAYMLWFRDMANREEAWGKFRNHPDWVAMRDKPEYANTVSKVNKIFLLPEAGSQI